MAKNLLVDIGNTRIKWATHESTAGLGPQHAEVHARWTLADFVRLTAAPAPDRIIVSNVAGPQFAALLTEATSTTWHIQPIFVRAVVMAHGVRNAYAEPEKLGVDRWVAMIAARKLNPGVICLVSVGTAMTIDVIDASGQHMGGLITPGPNLMVSSLLGSTSDIGARVGTLRASDAVLATDTAGAVHNGARHALAALIERAIRHVTARLAQTPTVILTGGGSSSLEPLLPFQCLTIPDLVLRGLAVLAQD